MAELSQFGATCIAPAKINLALHVTGQRSDGYHLLDSLVVFTDFSDLVSVQFSDHIAEGEINCDFTGAFGEALQQALSGDEDHLIMRAARHFNQSSIKQSKGLAIQVTKQLPIASGIGGGSADAAAVLLALQKLADEHSLLELMAKGALMGADVPMCLHSQSLLARGTGTETTLIEPLPILHLVLANPSIEISTPLIFKALQQKDNAPLASLPPKLTAPKLIDWLAQQRNDLEPAAISKAPQIKNVLDALSSSGAQLSRMSGSGATCFGIFKTEEASRRAAQLIATNQPDWWICETKSTHHGADRAVFL